MRILRPSAFASAVLAALVAGAATEPAAADKPGVARISDDAQPVATASYTAGSPCETGVCDGAVVDGRGYSPWRFSTRHGWLHHGAYQQQLRWDYIRGPAIHPAVRIPVGYQQWLPEVPYGDPRFGVPAGFPVAPMVYMPTDTTQLGYYYQRVPTWIPLPHMLPPPPYPSQYHRIDRPPVHTPVVVGSRRGGLLRGLFHHHRHGGSWCGNPQCGCGNCQCGPNCGCRMDSWSVPPSQSQPTPATPEPKQDSDPKVPPKPAV